MLILYSFSYI